MTLLARWCPAAGQSRAGAACLAGCDPSPPRLAASGRGGVRWCALSSTATSMRLDRAAPRRMFGRGDSDYAIPPSPD